MINNKYPGFFVGLLLYYVGATAQPLQKVAVKGGEMKQGERLIYVDNFKITQYEITNRQYASFLNAAKIGADGRYMNRQLINVISKDLQLEYLKNEWQPKQGKENYPMVMVSYYGAMEAAKWMKGRLPTEAEWFYAAIGGNKTNHYPYSGGNSLEEVGWFKGNSEQHSHPVGEKKPNELGIYDMSGNAWEWCRNDTLKSDDGFCVHMGGSWFAGEQPGRVDAIYGNMPTHFSNSVGFRVVFPASQKRVKRNSNKSTIL